MQAARECTIDDALKPPWTILSNSVNCLLLYCQYDQYTTHVERPDNSHMIMNESLYIILISPRLTCPLPCGLIEYDRSCDGSIQTLNATLERDLAEREPGGIEWVEWGVRGGGQLGGLNGGDVRSPRIPS